MRGFVPPWIPMPLEENESPTFDDPVEYATVIYCTGCGNRSAHVGAGGILTTTWRMTPREILVMRRELPKMRCDDCHGLIDLRVLDGVLRTRDAVPEINGPQ
jgi:hypothetical protein